VHFSRDGIVTTVKPEFKHSIAKVRTDEALYQIIRIIHSSSESKNEA
jgi:hypothetical protein